MQNTILTMMHPFSRIKRSTNRAVSTPMTNGSSLVRTLFLVSTTMLLCLPFSCHAQSFYVATLNPLGNSGVSGRVTIYVASDTRILYAGTATGLEPQLVHADNCTAANACGVHVHSGTSCESNALQGGHYFSSASDPWSAHMYTTDDTGDASFGQAIDMGGTDSLRDRAFVVHASNGSRVACGLLQELENDQVWKATLEPLGTSGVKGTVWMWTDGTGDVCVWGQATGLQKDLSAMAGDCSATNGCGTHVHDGLSCASSAEQGGHYWNKSASVVDPWKTVGYSKTSSNGDGTFARCVSTGILNEQAFRGRAFVAHANDGSRVSCGLLEKESQTSGACGSVSRWVVLVVLVGATLMGLN